MPAAASFDPIAHARHMAALERAKAERIRAGLVAGLPLGSQFIEYYAGLCDRNAAAQEAKADALAAEARKAA